MPCRRHKGRKREKRRQYDTLRTVGFTPRGGSRLLGVRALLSGALIGALLFPANFLAQQPPPSGEGGQAPPSRPQPGAQQSGGMSGIAGGVAAPAQYDEQKRPITAGGVFGRRPNRFLGQTQ